MTAAVPLSTIYRKHHAFVWRTLRCLGVADAAVDDAVQDVFVVVHRRLDEFEGRSALRTWLYEIARRVAWRHRKRAQADAVRSFELPELDAALDLDDAVARAQALEILRVFLDRLDEDKATVFVLTELGGLHGSEIAEDLGVNVNTVHARLRAARRELERMVVRLRARDRSGALPHPDRIAPMLVRERPSDEQQRRSWALLVAELGLGRATATPWLGLGLTSSTTPWIVAAVAVPLVAVVVVSMNAGRTQEPPADPEPVLASPAAAPRPEAPAPALAVSEPASPMLPAPAVTPSLPPSSLVAPTPSHARVERPATPAPTTDSLRRELALVESIRSARLHDAPRALGLVRRYRQAYPQGALAPEVAALEVEALCADANIAAARAAAERFTARWPESSLRTSSVDPCKSTSR